MISVIQESYFLNKIYGTGKTDLVRACKIHKTLIFINLFLRGLTFLKVLDIALNLGKHKVYFHRCLSVFYNTLNSFSLCLFFKLEEYVFIFINLWTSRIDHHLHLHGYHALWHQRLYYYTWPVFAECYYFDILFNCPGQCDHVCELKVCKSFLFI